MALQGIGLASVQQLLRPNINTVSEKSVNLLILAVSLKIW